MLLRSLALSCGVLLFTSACAPGYLKTADLEARQQGPEHCRERCQELGMTMGALVLVGNQQPGCVCLPPAGNRGGRPEQGASASAVGYVVVAAAEAAARQAQAQQMQSQSHRH